MTPDELHSKDDHDLLVTICADVKWANQKLERYCDKTDTLENAMLILQTEHNERKTQANCAPTSGLTSRQKTGLLTALGTALLALIMTLIEFFKIQAGR